MGIQMKAKKPSSQLTLAKTWSGCAACSAWYQGEFESTIPMFWALMRQVRELPVLTDVLEVELGVLPGDS
ncbi:MAG TPA: hypothetical protein PKB03_02590 [Baekduia sp.]|nr:hypothetical protein [Baekduia sp.]